MGEVAVKHSIEVHGFVEGRVEPKNSLQYNTMELPTNLRERRESQLRQLGPIGLIGLE